MDNNKLDILEELLVSDDGLLVLLRLGHGLNYDKIDAICDILKKLAGEWANKDSIPKKAAELFMDFYPAMESACGLYNEKEVEKIMGCADKITDLFRDCISSK